MSEDVEQIEEKQYPEPPPGIRVMANGGGQDAQSGKIVAGPGTYAPDPNTIKDSAMGSELATKRWEDAVRAGSEAIAEQAASILKIKPSHATEFDAWKLINAAQFDLAYSGDGRASTEAAKFIARSTNLMPPRHVQAAQVAANGGLTISMSAEIVDKLTTMVGQLRDKQG